MTATPVAGAGRDPANGTGTVAGYLATRLEQLGLDRMFGVAGNYTAAFLDTILADPDNSIAISRSANEICAGFAADAYARYRGVGAVFVTYSVGAFTLLNTIAGSFVEYVPVLLINGAPTNKETSIERNVGLLYSHTTGYAPVDINMFRPITAAAERITDSVQAPYQIDSALTAMLTQQRPGYLEVTEDVWRAPCRAPVGRLVSGAGAIVTRSVTDQAVAATMDLLRRRPRTVLWAGIELQRRQQQQAFLDLLDAVNRRVPPHADAVHFVTTASSKSVLPETNSLFRGCVTLGSQEIASLVGADGTLLGLGGWTTSKDTGSQNIRGPGTVLASEDGVVVGALFFPLVPLADYLAGLTAALDASPTSPEPTVTLRRLAVPSQLVHVPVARTPEVTADSAAAPAAQSDGPGITYDQFFAELAGWLTEDDILVVDAGFPLIGAQAVPISRQQGFVAQASWLSIGYSVPAATGVKCANPDARVVVVVGDGAFHETCQAVSDHTLHGQNTVVFVLSNGLYGIEQYLVNPNPFRTPPDDYADRLEDAPYPYNQLPSWDLMALAKGFGAQGHTAGTLAALRRVLTDLRNDAEANAVVDVPVPQLDIPHALAAAAAQAIGEDEISNPGWPSAATF